MHWPLISCVFLFLPFCTVSGQNLPTGFVDEVLATGLTDPVGIARLPDGRLLVTEQFTAAIKVVANGSVATVGTVPGVNSTFTDGGLLGIAVDPEWPARPYVYTIYDKAVPAQVWISMFTVTGDLSDGTSTNLTLGSQYNILTIVPDVHPFHNGGSLRFGPDGMLYASMGDDNGLCIAQNPALLRGCVMRFDVSTLPLAGSGPPPVAAVAPLDNPFQTLGDNAKLTWCYGLRNPFRFNIDPLTGDLFICDVGANSFEEVDVSTVGGENYGWPYLEASQTFATCVAGLPANVGPVAVIDHSLYAPGSDHSIVSFGFYRNLPGAEYAFGEEYEGTFFFSDHFVGQVRRIAWDGAAWSPVAAVPGQPNGTDWATGMDRIGDAILGSDGAIYWVNLLTGSVHRVRPAFGPRTLAVASGDGQAGNAGLSLTQPLQAQVTDGLGMPIAGVPVTFALTAGEGILGPQPVFTDAQGLASTTLVLGSVPGDPIIEATAPGALGPAAFTATWRGLDLSYDGVTGVLDLGVFHSETASPFTLVLEPAPAAPFLVLPFGEIWTSIIGPAPSFLAALDGLGLAGPPSPLWVTGSSVPTWTASFVLPPLGGLDLTFQAYAIDGGLFPAPDGVMISNPVTVFIN